MADIFFFEEGKPNERILLFEMNGIAVE